MKRIIAIDLDGTSLSDGQTIAQETLNGLQAAKLQGHEIVIATGRPLSAMHQFAKQIEPTAIVTSNGAVVMHYDEANFTVIHQCNLDGEKVKATLNLFEKDIATIWLEAHDQTLITSLHPNLQIMFETHRPPGFEYTLKILDQHDFSMSQVCLVLLNDGIDAEIKRQSIQKNLGDEYVVHAFDHEGVGFLEIASANVSKATGLEILNRTYGWTFEQMIAFGDQYNDFEMLQAVGHGVAMCNAPEFIQAIADDVTMDSNISGGVGTYLYQYLKL